MWVRSYSLPTGSGSRKTIVSKYSHAASMREFELMIGYSDPVTRWHSLEWNVQESPGSFNSSNIAQGAATLNINTWYHIAVVYKGGQYLRIYLNGNLEVENTSGVAQDFDDSDIPLLIGAYAEGGSLRFHGKIDDVGIWTRPISESEVDEIYNNGMSGIPLYQPVMVVKPSDNTTIVMEEGQTTDSISVELFEQPASSVTVTVEDISVPAQVTLSSEELIFTTTDWSTAQTITITAIDDDIREDNSHFTTISFSTSGPSPFDGLNAEVPVTIYDNECGVFGYLEGDVDGDCYVNLSDIAAIATDWLGNGNMDMEDLFVTAADWLKCTKPYAPGCLDVTTPVLWKEIDISAFAGHYIAPGDLTNDGRVDFVLYRHEAYTAPGYLVALDHNGNFLWDMGNPSLTWGRSSSCRGICSVYDIDRDGQSEVITEFRRSDGTYMLYILNGATGAIENSRESPFDMSIRNPDGYSATRSHPASLITHPHGTNNAPVFVMKYEASNRIPGHAFGLDASLNTLWHIAGTVNSLGHITTAADFDEDGRDEVVLGSLTADENGNVLWDKGSTFGFHADMTDVAELVAASDGKEILVSVCTGGPIYCLSSTGSILWQKTTAEVPHGQAVWVGNFLDDEPGVEAIVLRKGHVGDFWTLRGTDGAKLAEFQQSVYSTYPDFPYIVNWKKKDVQSLWIPEDRTLVDGRGNTVLSMGTYDQYVVDKLHPGSYEFIDIPVQVFALDLCGDDRDELVLYQPYNSESILIFTQPDSDGEVKPYVHQPNAYNYRSYY